MSLREDWGTSGGIIICDTPGCRRTRRHYATPTERDDWSSHHKGAGVLDHCPTHAEAFAHAWARTHPGDADRG